MSTFESNNVLTIKTVQIAPFRTLMTALKDILLETNITFKKDGIRIINMDKSHTMLAHLFLAAEKKLTRAKKKVLEGKYKNSMNRQKVEKADENLNQAYRGKAAVDAIDAGLNYIQSYNPYFKAITGSNVGGALAGIVYDSFSNAPDNEFLI